MSDFEAVMLPPQDLDTERALLGSLLFMNDAIDEISSQIYPESFYAQAHSLIYTSILKMHHKGIRGIDPVTLANELISSGHLEEIGGVAYIAQILDAVPHAAHVRYYAKAVAEHAVRREVIHLCREAVRQAYDKTQEITESTGELLSKLESISGRSSGDIRTMRQVVASLKEIQKHPPIRVSSGFSELDHLVSGGFGSGQLIIVAARPAMGKTAFATSLAEAATNKGQGSLIVPLEMEGEELAARVQLQGPERLEEIAGKPIFVQDTRYDLDSVCSTIILGHRRHGVRFVIVDYLSLIEVETRENNEQKLARITRRLKLLAKKLKIPIVLLAQLNRECEKRDNKRPQLSDLRGSGAIEQDADIVMFLYRHEVYYPDEIQRQRECEVIVAKQRNGPTGTVFIGYIREETKFVDKRLLPFDPHATYEFPSDKKSE